MIKMKKRVLHIIPSLSIGGAGCLITNLLCSLDKTSFEAGLCSLYADTKNGLSERLKRSGVDLFFLNKKKGLDISIFFRLCKTVKTYKPDIIHVHQRSIIYSLLPALLYQVPLRLETIHSVAEWEGGRAARIIRRFAYKYCCFKPIAVSKNVAASIERVYKIRKAPVIYNGIPVENFQFADPTPPIDSDNLRLAHIARFSPEKNHTLLIMALKKVVRVKPDRIKVLLIGSGPGLEPVKDMVCKHCLENVVEILGERHDIPELLRHIDCLVLTSNLEGLPLVVLEAMAASKPVIATSVGGIPEVITDGKNGILVPANDADKLAETIISLIDNREYLVAMGSNGAAMIQQRFNISRVAREYEQLYVYGYEELLKA